MPKRYHITLGAATTAGGTVTRASAMMSIDDVRIALEGDDVSCPACNATGIIQADGPRLGERFNGRQVALSGDLCICKCSPPPRLVNSQTHRAQCIDGAWPAAQGGAPGAGAAPQNTAAGAAGQGAIPLQLRDPDTKAPFRYRLYRLELTGGAIEGTTDGNGLTRPLTASERASVVTWQVDGDTTPVRT